MIELFRVLRLNVNPVSLGSIYHETPGRTFLSLLHRGYKNLGLSVLCGRAGRLRA